MSIFTLSQKINLAKNVIVKRPIYVQFYITARCNLACEQCSIIHADAKHQEMNIEQINKVAENLKKIGVNIVLLIGGEPFVRKDIHHIVQAFTKRNIHVRMQTNGIATEKQLYECLPNNFENSLIAYEPIWSIGTGKIPSAFEIQEMHTHIKKIVFRISNKKTNVLYGGSVNTENINEILKITNVDGVLVGGASLKAKDFLAIYSAAVKYLDASS